MKWRRGLAVLLFTVAFSATAHAGIGAAPELDPGIVGSAFLMIGGVALIVRGRRAKKS